jgi:glucokinase
MGKLIPMASRPRRNRHVVAVDIGGSKIAVLAREVESGREVFADKLKTPASSGVDAILELLDAEIDAIPGGRSTMVALGVAVPGHVDPRGHVLRAGNLDGWIDVPLRSLLERRYSVPVFVEQDANCGALGEKCCGAAEDMDDFVFLALGTGVGAGLYLGGRIYRGSHCAAGEAGDLTLSFKHGEVVSDLASKRAIKKKGMRASGVELSAAEALAQAPHERRLARATRDAVDAVSSAVDAIAALLDPEAIFFGGGTSKAGEALLRRVRKRIGARRARLICASLGPQAQLYGALWGAEQLLGAPNRAATGRRAATLREARATGAARLRRLPRAGGRA